jgi:hypothetical protein
MQISTQTQASFSVGSRILYNDITLKKNAYNVKHLHSSSLLLHMVTIPMGNAIRAVKQLKYLRSVIQQNSLCDLESGKKKKIDW